jgi:hypothetical protein
MCFKRRERLMLQRAFFTSCQPLMVVLGLLTGAAAAKSGHGAWVAGGILIFLPTYFGAALLTSWRPQLQPRATICRARAVANTGEKR